MKITDFIPTSFRAIVPQPPILWLGRALQPIKTPLTWLFPFALLAGVFYVLNKIYHKPPPTGSSETISITEPVSRPSEEVFCKKHRIGLESPLLNQIEDFESTWKTWEEEGDSNRWNLRVATLKSQADKLGILVQNNAELTQITSDLKNPKLPVLGIYENLRKVVNSLKPIEIERQKTFLQTIQDEIQKEPFSSTSTLEGFLQLVVPPDRLSYYQHILPERGVLTLEDIDLLDFRTWDTELNTLIVFKCALKAHPENVSIQTALFDFLKKLAETIQTENRKGHICILENYIDSADQFLVLIKNPNEKIKTIFQAFDLLYREKKNALLDAYINQYKCDMCWKKLKKSDPSMSITTLREQHPNEDFYHLEYFIIV
ncbi:MAG: hypothetical protein ACRDFB_04260 [Rhabdochlamydiaceae bacterium]